MPKSATAYRKDAYAARERPLAAITRSQQGHFAPQWADRLQAELAIAKAQILDTGARAIFTGLYKGDRRLATRLIETQYGPRWLLRQDEVRRFKRHFIPFTGKPKSRVQIKLGLSERKELAPVWAKIIGTGEYSSDCASSFIARYRDGHDWGLDATVVT